MSGETQTSDTTAAAAAVTTTEGGQQTNTATINTEGSALNTALSTDAAKGAEQQAGQVTQPTWPEKWRDLFAKGDTKRAERLGRYGSPEAVADALFAAQQKISSGELRSAFPDKGTAEEQAAWRKENGLPEKPEDYHTSLKLPNGLVIGEEDKPIVDKVFAAAHGANIPPAAVSAIVASYYEAQDELLSQRAEQDDGFRLEAEDAMRAEWGADYRRNLNAIQGFLDTAPDGLKERILNARLGDGRPLGSDPDALRWLGSLALASNPLATVMPGGGDQMQNLDSEIAELKKVMIEQPDVWYRDPKKQERYQELLRAKEKVSGKAA